MFLPSHFSKSLYECLLCTLINEFPHCHCLPSSPSLSLSLSLSLSTLPLPSSPGLIGVFDGIPLSMEMSPTFEFIQSPSGVPMFSCTIQPMRTSTPPITLTSSLNTQVITLITPKSLLNTQEIPRITPTSSLNTQVITLITPTSSLNT